MPWYQQFNLDGKLTTKVGFMNEEYFAKIRPLFPEDLTDKVILDLCCNAGFVSFKLAELGAFASGIEVNPTYLEQAETAAKFYPNNRVQFFLQDVEELDYNYFDPDIIVALSCLYHLKQPLKTIKKICEQGVPLIVSFREHLYEQFINYFKLFGKTVVGTASYGKKIAARLE